MWGFASSQLKTLGVNTDAIESFASNLVESVAPSNPHSHALSLLAHGDSSSFINLLQTQEITPHTPLNSTGALPLHCSCHYSCLPVVTYLIDSCNVPLEQFDQTGSTPLHYAAKANDLNLVKHLINDRGHKCNLKNAAGKTPYDLATDAYVRQVILPKQLQEQTVAETAAGTLPFGIDRNKPAYVPPPPIAGGGSPLVMPPTSSLGYANPPPPQNSQPPTTAAPYQPAYAPPPGSRRVIKSDGFHSSASDPVLQQRYGHKQINTYTGPPPPTNLPPPPSVPPPSAPAVGARGKYVVVDYNNGGELSGQVYGSTTYPPHPQPQPPVPQYNNIVGEAVQPPTSSLGFPPPPNSPAPTPSPFSPPSPVGINSPKLPLSNIQTQSFQTQVPLQPPPTLPTSTPFQGGVAGLPPPPFSTFNPNEAKDVKEVGSGNSAIM
ncbi:hypothetical protein TrVE_jg14442 [Triparma verrucosa]|uniref:Uncharacterized protein n=1 Tax=Triparma verrucosa TaxID=1606542 RepID=A0A9W7BZL8_9STRA|nr:hypothetical protein TrVE_jg14442 [Triparma verrucosa]